MIIFTTYTGKLSVYATWKLVEEIKILIKE